MEIVRERSTTVKKLSEVLLGESFNFKGSTDVYLRCRPSRRVTIPEELFCAVGLSDNVVMAFNDGNMLVEILNVKLLVVS